MFNTFLTNILNSYLGEIVEDLDLDNIGSGALHGDILLIDLKLRPDCLSVLELPLEVKFGSIGKLSLKIPWTSLASSPVTVNIQDVFIVAVPLNHRPYYARQDENLERTRKRRFLQKLEGISVLKKAAVSQNSKEEKLKRELWETMVATFMNNVQLQIERVHIRYEDVTSVPGMIISGGLCLQSLTAETTNSKWKETEINGKASTIFKLVKFSKFSLYCVCDDKVEVGKQNNNNWRLAMRDILETVSQGNYQHHEVLAPLSGRMKIMMNRSIRDGSPRLLFDYVLKDLQIQLSKPQYHAMMAIQSAWKFLELSRIHRKFRPRQLVRERPKLWWKYAFNCIRVHFILPYTWTSIKQHREKYRGLVELWEKRWRQGKSSAVKQQIKDVEWRLDVTSIMIAREQAKVLARRPSQPQPTSPPGPGTRNKLKSFVSGVIAERKAALVNQPMFSFLSSTNIELQLLEICKAMGCSFEPDDSIKPRSYIEHVFNFSLQRCVIRLRSIMVCRIINFNVCIETRPSALAYTVACRTENFNIETDGSDREAQPTPVLTSNNLVHSQDIGWPNLFKLVFEKNPLSCDTDFKLDIQLLPVQIYYNEEVFSELLDFLFLPQMDVIQVAWGFIYQGYKYGLQFSRFVRNCLTSRVVCDLNIDLRNPCITVGQYGKMSQEGSNLIIDCGRLQVETARVSEHKLSKKYEEFEVTVSGVQVVHLPSRMDWAALREEPSSEYHIVPTTKVKLTLSTSTLLTQDIPAWKLDVFVKCAKLNLSDSKLSNIIDFLRDLPLPSRNRNMQKTQTRVKRWKIDKRWIIPNIGKLELLYLENQLSDQDPVTNDKPRMKDVPVQPKKPLVNGYSSDDSSANSLADLDVQAYCREIDLPGFEDNISAGNKMVAVVQVSVMDAGLIFDRASGSCDKSYLYLGASNIHLDVGVMEHGPAIQLGVETVKLLDRQAGVDLISIGPSGGSEQANAVNLLYRYISPSCPEFRSVFKSVQHSVVWDVGNIHCVLHKTSLWTLYNAASFIIEKSNISMEDIKPVYKKSKSALKKLKKWKPFKICKSDEGTQHVFLNFSLRLHQFGSVLCDSDQEFLNFSLSCLEMDAVFKPRNKLVFRTFISQILMEDITQFSLFPKVLSVEEGDALELKITINLKENQQTSGSFAANIGHFHILVLHRVTRLLQFYFSPLDFWMLVGSMVRAFHWMIGPSLKIFLNKEKFVDIKFKIEGPTFIIPEGRENPHVIAISLGKILVENLLTKDGKVQNLMLELQQGQIYSGFMGIHQSLELLRVIMPDLSCKADCKIESSPSARQYCSVLAVEDVTASLDTGDIILFSNILHNNILKLKFDLCSLLDFIPVRDFLTDEDDEVLLSTDVTVQNQVMVDRITVNLDHFNEDQTDEDCRSSSPSNDTDTIFKIQFFHLDYLFQKDAAGTSTKSFTVEKMEFVDVKAELEEQWLVDNIEGKPVFHYNENDSNQSNSLVLGFNVDTFHIYPRTVEKLFSFFLLPTNMMEPLRAESQDSLETCSSSSDIDCTTEEEEEQEEGSSGYQTSTVRSPQIGQIAKERKISWKIPVTNFVYHCSDVYRKNLFIAKLGGKLESTRISQDYQKHILYVDLEALDHYDHGLTFQVWKKFSLLINSETKEEKVSGYVNVTPTEIRLNRKVFEEAQRVSQLMESLVDCFDPTWETPRELWTQRKIKKDRRQSSDKHPLREIISRTFLCQTRKSHGVNLKLDQTEFSVLYHNHYNQPILATKIKLSGKFRKPQICAEFEGSASVECIAFNQQINRWEHLLESKHTSGPSVNLHFVSGWFDLTTQESLDGLDDVPFHSETLSVEELFSGECLDTEEKLKVFLNNYVISDDKASVSGSTEDSPGCSDCTSSSRSADVKSFTAAGRAIKQRQFSLIVDVKDEILINMTSSLCKIVNQLTDGDINTSRITPGGGVGRILNQLGHEADIVYSEIRDGKVEVVMEDPVSLEETSSDEEFQSDDLPWKKCMGAGGLSFKGFEEAGVDNVTELTRVITSNILNIDVPDFQPVKILLPKREEERILSLNSELDHDTYSFLLSSSFTGLQQQIELKSCLSVQNKTSFSLAIYVESDNLHWSKSNKDLQQNNPFARNVKLTELCPGAIYSLPVCLTKEAKIFFKPVNSKSSLSDSFFSTSQTEYEEPFFLCKSLESTSTYGFRVKLEEENNMKCFQIKPIVTILNRLSVPDSQFLVEAGSYKDLYEYNPANISLEVNGSQCPLKLPPSWITEEASSPISCHTRCNDLMLDRLLITAGNGQLKLEANFEVINETSQDFVIDAGKQVGRYRVNAGKTTFMSGKVKETEPVTSLKFVNTETGSTDLVSLVSEEDGQVVGTAPLFYVEKKVTKEICLIRLCSLWAVRNKTEKEFLIQESHCLPGGGKRWTVVESGGLTPVFTQQRSPTFVLRDSVEASQTDEFQLTPDKPKLCLRLNSVSGLNLALKTQQNEQNIIEICELAGSASVPFTFHNSCVDLVVKIRQAGEAQCWLLSPGHQLDYSWDNNLSQAPHCVWTVYGGCDQPLSLNHRAGALLWGEEKILYKTIRKLENLSTSDSESSDCEGSEDDKRRGSVVSRKKNSVTSPSVPQNIVYKHKKTIFWISDSVSSLEKTSVYFLTSRKLAVRQLRRLREREAGWRLQLSGPGLHLSVLSERGEERLSVISPRQAPQWSLLINNTWRHLGLELSAAIEVAQRSGLPGLEVKNIFKVDLKQLVVTSPVFAPLRRLERPGLAVQAGWTPRTSSQLSLGLAELQLRRAGLMAATLRELLVKMERLAGQPWASLLNLNIQTQQMEVKSKEVFAAANVGGAVENFLEMMKRQKISVSSLQLEGFQLSIDCPAEQFYQRILRAGQISPRSEIPSLEISIYDKSVESTINLISSHILMQLWADKPVRTATTDKISGFWKTILHHRELYIPCVESGSILDSPHYVKAHCEAPENSVLHHLLQHQKLTSEDKTNFYRRLLNSRAPGGYLGLRRLNVYTAVGHHITREVQGLQDLYIHHVCLETLRTILVTDRHCVSLRHNKSKTSFKQDWAIPINRIHNLPLLEKDRIIIHVAQDNKSIEPLLILCDNFEKLKSIQLALEYSLLLTMPFTSLKYDRKACQS